VRHSKATDVAIVVTAAQATGTVVISDNGPAAAEQVGPLAGVPALTAGPDGRSAVEPHGFRLRVVVPLSPAGPSVSSGVSVSPGETRQAGRTMGG
jgi:hypothetical protein